MEQGSHPTNSNFQGNRNHNHLNWMQQSYRGNQPVNGEVTVDCHGDAGESSMDNLLDRSGLFDELVCQILDEGSPNTEAEIKAVDIQQTQHVDAAIKDQTSADMVSPAWAKSKTATSHENKGHPTFPPGITERPTHPASFGEMYRSIPISNGQGSMTHTATEQPIGIGKANSNDAKRMPEYFQPGHFMKGDNLETQQFNASFPGQSWQGNTPNSGGDCGNIPLPTSESQYCAPGMNLRNQSMGFCGGQDSHRDAPVTEDPHQYFRQRATAAQQAHSCEQFPRHSRPSQQIPINKQQQANSSPFTHVDVKTQLMQMTVANNWENFNNLVTKGNLNLRTSTLAFDQNQMQRNINVPNLPFGQNRLPNYQFSLHHMSSPHQASVRNQNHGQQTSSGGQFQGPPFPIRPQYYNQPGSQNVAFWPQSQQYQHNDNQNYLDQLHVQLEECYYQFYSIEKERKKTEIELARLNPGRRISSANTIPAPQLPDNPTSLDRLIVDFYKEHSRVITLMSKIGGLCAEAVHPSIDACLDSWVEAIQEAEVKRREELLSFGSGRRQQDDNEELAEHKGRVLVDVIQKLALATRSIRTALWCALQMSKENTTLYSD